MLDQFLPGRKFLETFILDFTTGKSIPNIVFGSVSSASRKVAGSSDITCSVEYCMVVWSCGGKFGEVSQRWWI